MTDTYDRTLDDRYRHGGPPIEDRRPGRDSITRMRQVEHRPDMLWNDLIELAPQLDRWSTFCNWYE
jgi:hypothetical protein